MLIVKPIDVTINVGPSYLLVIVLVDSTRIMLLLPSSLVTELDDMITMPAGVKS